MGGISIWQLLILFFCGVLPAWAILRITNKMGYSRWWALTMLIPVVNVVMIWVAATVEWKANK